MFRAKAKRVYVGIENLMSRQSCLRLCHDRVYLKSRQKVPGHGVSMSRHSALCRNTGVRHCVATRLCVRVKDALSRQCGVVLHRNREGYARAIEKAMCVK